MDTPNELLDDSWIKTIPEGAIVDEVVHIVNYIDPETGEGRYTLSWQGSIGLAQLLGIMRMAEQDILNESRK
jgi:hypothetical protein